MGIEAKQYPASFLSKFELKIPYFQRRYVWDEENNWERFYDNFMNKEVPGFIGSIILQGYKGKHGENPAKIIDGQQRITTFSLFLLALYMNVPKKDMDGCRSKVEQILFSQNMNDYNYTPRLELGYLDKKSYKEIFNYNNFVNGENIEIDADTIEKDVMVKKCYKYFNDKLKLEDDDTKINVLKSLVMNDNIEFYVGITIDENDDEQVIFDTLNTTGKPLTNADTIKNYLFEKELRLVLKEENGNNDIDAAYKKVEEKYKETWYKHFENDEEKNQKLDALWNEKVTLGMSVKRAYIDMFLHAYVIILDKYGLKNNLDELVKIYKKIIDEINTRDELEKFIDDICNYAEKYRKYFMQPTKEKEYKYDTTNESIIDRILLTNTSTFYPYILYLLLNYEGQKLTEELHKVEKYLYLDLIYRVNPNSEKNYNKLALQFLNKKKNGEEDNDSIEEKIKEIEGRIKSGSQPIGLYDLDNRTAKRLLFIIELYRSYSRTNSDKHNETFSFPEDSQLEHIMPRKWRNNWKDELCNYTESGKELKEYEEKANYRDEKLKYLGNMTILKGKLNGSISDSQMFVKMYGLNEIKHDPNKSVSENADYSITTRDVIKYYSDELLKTEYGREIDALKNSIKEKLNKDIEVSKEEWQKLGEKCEELKVKDNIWNEERIMNRTKDLLEELNKAVLY